MNTEEQHLQELVQYLLQFDTPESMRRVLEGLLTPAELHAISQRLQITRLLKAGVSQREVARQLGVGIATVTRGSRALQAGKLDDM
ncbi:trp operon repressor [Gilvimarinus agarilyticus]|uniref:YerC/YecD family TrpR-related protein n=1 Tax=unclassified Gilvimarinus TaxID=2642066 RepID=UPI001C0914E9|nr:MULTISPECIES: YerC/YecD family TrpR-related protein [unclassified Gilvimarinus]MBU2886448.1 trp operon repressor [Gilvimarinus agarilyticus]MDO6571127.1 YerC/YecD family TrpR-related protein [Gilvimarinus sp. 2_MG-2023]MDO6745670.1 YerC/YecD family TrpR-related protein [Gilvimarinus sp. 1_MG-2023]